MPQKSKHHTFRDSVRAIVAAIPTATVRTYGDIAREAGHPRAARAVANIMAANFDPCIPCHRVIRADGHLGGYNRGGTAAKFKKLKEEGVDVSKLRYP